MPKVSVILTSYNHEKYIAQSIDSVLAQTFTDFELIIADDCSTDNSWSIIQSYNDPRIRAVRSAVNLRTLNFYNAIQTAQGEYLAVHHSDDVWLPEKLKKQVEHLDAHTKHAMVFTHGQYIDEDNIVVFQESSWLTQQNRSRHAWLRDFFFQGNLLCHPTVLMRYEYAGKVYADYGPTGYNDWRAWIKICLQNEIHVLQENLFCFRIINSFQDNDGGNNLGTYLRFEIDLPWVLELYRRIPNLEEWQLVFPECADYVVNGEFEADYFFAMLCLQNEKRPACKYFGLNLLMHTLNDPEKRESIYNLYGFTAAKMAKIATQHDPFGLSTRADLEQAQADLEQAQADLEQEQADLERAQADLKQAQADLILKDTSLQSIISSRSWRITKPLRKLANFLRNTHNNTH